MLSFRSLFAHRVRPRCYALLDGHGTCLGFHQGFTAPQGPAWVEVTEFRLAWLHRPLPASAQVKAVTPPSKRLHPLTA